MSSIFLKLYVKFRNLKESEEGQDLTEYALLFALVSLALVTSLHGIASAISTVFNSVSSTLGS